MHRLAIHRLSAVGRKCACTGEHIHAKILNKIALDTVIAAFIFHAKEIQKYYTVQQLSIISYQMTQYGHSNSLPSEPTTMS